MSHMPQVDVKLIHGVNKPFYNNNNKIEFVIIIIRL